MKKVEIYCRRYYDAPRISDLEEARRLVENKKCHNDGSFATRVICYGAHTVLMKKLLEEEKGNIDWNLALDHACRAGDIDFIKYLIKSMYDYDYDYKTLCLNTDDVSNMEIIKYFIDLRVKVTEF